MRGTARKQARNQSVKSRLRSLQTNYTATLTAGKKEESTTALRTTISALDKAVKAGVMKRSTANRKKSRLTLKLNAKK